MKIKFSHNYKKIAGVTKAKLIEVINVNLKNLSKEFLFYDTEDIYKFPNNCDYMMLIFYKIEQYPSKSSNLFTTLRRRTDEKEKYYRGNIGKIFTLEIESKQHNA